MREIKFKAIDAITGEWVYGYYRQFNPTGQRIIHIISTVEGVDYIVQADSVSQSLNHKDNSGTEVYSGDIIKYDYDWDYAPGNPGSVFGPRLFKKETKKHKPYIGVVTWEGEKEHAHYVIMPGRMNFCPVMLLVEVIGHKFLNPELIPEKYGHTKE